MSVVICDVEIVRFLEAIGVASVSNCTTPGINDGPLSTEAVDLVGRKESAEGKHGVYDTAC